MQPLPASLSSTAYQADRRDLRFQAPVGDVLVPGHKCFGGTVLAKEVAAHQEQVGAD